MLKAYFEISNPSQLFDSGFDIRRIFKSRIGILKHHAQFHQDLISGSRPATPDIEKEGVFQQCFKSKVINISLMAKRFVLVI